MDVPSYPRSQKSSIAASRAAFLSKLIGRPVFPFPVSMVLLSTGILDRGIVHPTRLCIQITVPDYPEGPTQGCKSFTEVSWWGARALMRPPAPITDVRVQLQV